MFENLIADVRNRTGMGDRAANDLLRAVAARLLHGGDEAGATGFAAFLTTLRTTEPDLVGHWLSDDPKAGAISATEAERFLGADWTRDTANAIGVAEGDVRQGAAVALPGVIHEMTPGGMIPAASELEASYAGWAGGRIVVRELDTSTAPLADFPEEPADARVIEMELARPSVPIVAKARDGRATLIPWAILLIGAPVVMLGTFRSHPKAAGDEAFERKAASFPKGEPLHGLSSKENADRLRGVKAANPQNLREGGSEGGGEAGHREGTPESQDPQNDPARQIGRGESSATKTR